MVRQLSGLVRHLSRTAACNGLVRLSDGELLQRFIADQDALAFEALVRRHGPMVLGVCGRVLGRTEDAEDAFQATFLVLVRQARAVRPDGSLGGWLYRVARRVSTRLGRERVRRAARERQAARPEAIPAGTAEPSDWRGVLDREVERLPEVYRGAFILCHLEGRAQADAARELGCPVGTLQSRLARAKERLRENLSARGVALPTLAAGVISAPLATATVSAAVECVAGAPISATATAVALSQEVGNTMGFLKAKFALLALVATAALGPAVGYFGPPAAPAATAAVCPDPTLEDLKKENERLRHEVADLKKKLAATEALLPHDDPPSDQEVLRALPKLARSTPYLSETFRDNITIVKQKILDRLDPPRNVPNVGQARLRCQHWECSVYFTETVEMQWPFPVKTTKSRVTAVYIDKNTLVPVKGTPK